MDFVINFSHQQHDKLHDPVPLVACKYAILPDVSSVVISLVSDDVFLTLCPEIGTHMT